MMVIVKAITMEEFASFRSPGRGGPAPSPQLLALRQMQPGEGLILNHDGLACRRGVPGQRNFCSLAVIASEVTKQRNVQLSLHHLPNGTVAVACTKRKVK